MSVFNKAKLTNLRKRIEKEYDLEKCPFAQRILDTITECYDECSTDRDTELRKEKAEYLDEYRQRDVECYCGKLMLVANIYQHQKLYCQEKEKGKEYWSISRREWEMFDRYKDYILEYAESKKSGIFYGREYLTETMALENWENLKKLALKMNESRIKAKEKGSYIKLDKFKNRMKTEYNLDLL